MFETEAEKRTKNCQEAYNSGFSDGYAVGLKAGKDMREDPNDLPKGCEAVLREEIMFEKKAEEYKLLHTHYEVAKRENGAEYAKSVENVTIQEAFREGAESGYNKANEWHYVKDGDFPKEDSRPRTFGYYLTASRHKAYKGFVFEVAYFTGTVFTRDGQIGDNVVAWKEIVPPELKESE